MAADLEPWFELLPHPPVHPDFAALPALSPPDEDRAAVAVEVALLDGERFADPQAGTAEQHDQRPESMAVSAVTGRAHNRDDLLDRRWVGRVLLALVAWRAASVIPGMVAGERRWRRRPAARIP
jgi:hypothetical protein